MDYRQEMWNFAIDSSRLMFGVKLMPGPAITGDGDCILGATNSQVFVWLFGLFGYLVCLVVWLFGLFDWFGCLVVMTVYKRITKQCK